MAWDEKKTDKMHIRLTPRVGAAARASAEQDRRKFQDQLGVLVEEALTARGYFVQGNRVTNEDTLTHDAAQQLPIAGPIAAPRRTVGKKGAA